jgi:hypothetical protein
MAKEPTTPRDEFGGLASVGDDVIYDGTAATLGTPPLKKTTELVNIDDLPDPEGDDATED